MKISYLLLTLNLVLIGLNGLSNHNDSLFYLFEQGKYEEVSSYSFALLDTAKTSENKGLAYKFLGNVYSVFGETDKAKKYYEISLTHDYKSATLSNLGLIYIDLNDLDSATVFFNKAMDEAQTYQSKVRALNNLVVVNLTREEYEEALRLIEQVLNLAKNEGDLTFYFPAQLNKAQIFMELDQFDRSDSLFLNTLKEIKTTNNFQDYEKTVYYNLFILNLKQKNIDSAYHYHLAWEELTNELTGESVQKQLAEQEQAYENKILKLENRQKSFRLKATIWGSVGLVLVIILGVYLLYSYRENKRLRMVKVFADRWENESQKIAGWLIHELGQRVMAMRFMYQSRNDQLLEVADEGLEMLNTMSDHLYNMGLEGSGLKVILEGLVENHREVHQTEIELKFDGIRNLQHVHNEVKIYTILRDLLGAVVKHEKIKIHLSHTDRTQITVSLEREAEVIKAILEPRVIGAGKISVNKNTINLFIK